MKFKGRTATSIIPYSENRILLIKRITPPFIDYWALPGGRSETGEKVEQTAVREVQEETGLDVEVVRKVDDYREKGVQEGYEYDYYAACFVVKCVGGQFKRQKSEVDEIRLFALNELPDALAFEHARMIKDYVTNEAKNEKTFS